MSRRMSSFRSFLWHQRFGYFRPPAEPAPVEAPPRKPVRNEPMLATVRMGHYLEQHGRIAFWPAETQSIQLMYLTPAQRHRWRKKLNQTEKRSRGR